MPAPQFLFRMAPLALLGGLLMLGVATCLTGCSNRSAPEAPASHSDSDTDGGTGRGAAAAPEAQAESTSSSEFDAALDWFRAMTRESGVDFEHVSGTNDEKPFPAANGSGLAALDYDRDGRVDLYFLTGIPFPIASDATARNRVYRNLTSEPDAWQFVDVTEQAGLGYNGYSAGVAVGDYDGDGYSDVYLSCYGGNRLYRNQGDGTFEDVSEAAGVADPAWGTSAAFLDFDNDGHLDLYVCNYAQWSWETNKFCGDRERNVRLYCSPQSVAPAADVLYRNLGNGRFEDVTETSGANPRPARSQGVVAADLNDDGRIDLYVGNDLHANTLLINEDEGRFRDETEVSGAGYDSLGNAQAGMGVDVADIDADGRLDLFVTNFQGETNALYLNDGNALFHETSQRLGLTSDSLPWIGWGTAFADFNLDGELDVIVTNGHVDDNRHLLGQDAPYRQPPGVWRKQDGRFHYLGGQAGDYFRAPHTGRGLVVADLDNDGDQDVAIGHQDAGPALLANRARSGGLEHEGSSGPNPVLQVRLVGTQSNRDAVGARLKLSSGETVQYRSIHGGGSYLSAPDLRRVFAVERDQKSLELEIRWPSGARSVLTDLHFDHLYFIIEPSSSNSSTRSFSRRLLHD